MLTTEAQDLCPKDTVGGDIQLSGPWLHQLERPFALPNMYTFDLQGLQILLPLGIFPDPGTPARITCSLLFLHFSSLSHWLTVRE